MGNNAERKDRFLPFLPYGFCSHLATILVGRSNPYAKMLRLGAQPDDILVKNEQYKHNHQEKMNKARRKGLFKESTWKCGTPPTERAFRTLTKAGLVALAEAPDKAIQQDREWEEPASENNGKIKGTDFRNSSQQLVYLQELLDAYAEDPTATNQHIFSNFLLDAVIDGLTTPLTQALTLVPLTKINNRKYSPNQIYNIWRNSHISTMFHLNNYLTYLDRRPYDTGFALDGITDEESYQKYIERYGHTMASLTYYALTRWYSSNPGYYEITQRYPDESDAAKAAWISAPAYYMAKELPGWEKQNAAEHGNKVYGSQQKFKTIFTGLATGKKQTYICYHAHPGAFKWNPKREKEAQNLAEQAIRDMKTQNPKLPYNENVNYGMYFCASYHQFLAIFEHTKRHHKKNKYGHYLTREPFISLHAIPVNDGGCFLLWFLMELSPGETEIFIGKWLVANDANFQHQTNYFYPLTYQGKRVFLGHTMDINKINHVLEDYLDGMPFYLCCFPDQVRWYKHLFPGITIL